MKNIHLIKTDKPSRLHLWTDENGTRPALCELEYSHTRNTQHIYITNDEQAKQGDWGYIPFQGGDIKLVGKYFADDWKKIILTTDQDLIADGIEQISEDVLLKIVEHINSGKNIESFNEL